MMVREDSTCQTTTTNMCTHTIILLVVELQQTKVLLLFFSLPLGDSPPDGTRNLTARTNDISRLLLLLSSIIASCVKIMYFEYYTRVVVFVKLVV
jgi:hypothetical protein